MAKKIILILFVAIGVIGFVNKDRILNFWESDTRTINSQEIRLIFRNDPSLTELTNTLINEGVYTDNKIISDFINENNIDTNSFAAGKYIILSQTSISQLLNGFIKDENGNGISEVKVNVVFNRCKTIEDIGSNISKCILADSASIVDNIYSSSTLAKYHFTREQIPALFLPKDYQMYFDTDAEEFVDFMANEFKSFWTDERKEKLREIGLEYPSQAVTIASIVFAEQSKQTDEWPIIAGLYLNRIRKGMKLESDPTFKFCWGNQLDGVERLLNKHREIDCPYNTYKYQGLPPGPICIPPAEVIDAVLNPAQVDYLFMCGKPGGQGHNFAVTNAEHERNARIYRKWLKEYLADKN